MGTSLQSGLESVALHPPGCSSQERQLQSPAPSASLGPAPSQGLSFHLPRICPVSACPHPAPTGLSCPLLPPQLSSAACCRQVPLLLGGGGLQRRERPSPAASSPGPRGKSRLRGRAGAGVMENPDSSQGQCLQTQPGLEPALPPGPAPSGYPSSQLGGGTLTDILGAVLSV